MPEDITLRTIQIDEKPLIYSLERKDVKNINLHVRKNGSVYVSANKAVTNGTAQSFWKRRKICWMLCWAIIPAIWNYSLLGANGTI